jgi:SAM-dependent methyltransferase
LAGSAVELGAAGFRAVEFQVTSFEDFATGDSGPSRPRFDLIISGAAFHWIDPEIRFGKAALLLRPGGWLALVGSQDRYDDPVGAGLDALWAARDDSDGAWLNPVPERELIAATGLFAEATGWLETQRLTLPAGTVLDAERTRATYLSLPESTRREFTGDLARLLRPHPEVSLTRRTTVTMAQTMP